MSTHNSNIRGLQNIRTLSGRAYSTSEPHHVYMKITVLEMEKARRTKERQSAMSRVENIDARSRAIEAEKAKLLQSVEEEKTRTNEEKNNRNTQTDSTEGFRFRY
jgi:hypothetical protein